MIEPKKKKLSKLNDFHIEYNNNDDDDGYYYWNYKNLFESKLVLRWIYNWNEFKKSNKRVIAHELTKSSEADEPTPTYKAH